MIKGKFSEEQIKNVGQQTYWSMLYMRGCEF